MTHDKRDKAIDAWLKRPQHDLRASVVDECPDEETLAAWLEGSLEGEALDQMLTHASMCERCEAIAATVLRTEAAVPAPDADGPAAPWWRRWLAWGVPLTAAATAVVALAVWVRTPVVPSSRVASTPSAAVAVTQGSAEDRASTSGTAAESGATSGAALSAATQPGAVPDTTGSKTDSLVDARANTSQGFTSATSDSKESSARPPQPGEAAGASDSRQADSLRKSEPQVDQRSAETNALGGAVSGGLRERASQFNDEQAKSAVTAPRVAASESNAAAPAAGPVAAIASPPAVAAPQTAAVAPPQPTAPRVAAATPPVPPASPSPRRPAPAAQGSTADSPASGGSNVVIPPTASQANRDSGAGSAAATAVVGSSSTRPAALASTVDAAPAWTVLLSSANTPLWRFRGREIERSLDGGASWRRVVGDAPAALLSGVSVSQTVSWYAGERGTVLLVTNGQSSTVPFPQSADLVTIRATSDLAATVTTRDGRVFTTSDAGRTWRTP